MNESMQTQLQVAPPQLPQSVRPSKVFETYWRFAAERQEIFFRRLGGARPPWTADPILREFKFTNAYRASDRVSQYLIKRVIYAGDQNPDELIFRILVFKMFNRIETWELLEESLGGISLAAYDFDRYDSVLTNAMAAGARIYSAAYIMPSGGRKGDGRKHRDHLRLIECMMRDGLATQLRRCKSMRQGFQILRSYPMVGDFLAYQFITDINYSTLTDFCEMEFTVPGPGARDGIHKCFESTGGLAERRHPHDGGYSGAAVCAAWTPFSVAVGETAAADRLPEPVLRGQQVCAVCTSRCRWAHWPYENQAEVPD